MSLNIQTRFGVPWLDAWFATSLDDDKLGETFLRFYFVFLSAAFLKRLATLRLLIAI